MATNIEVPALGESITEAIVARWIKQVGERVATDEPIVELETDKITVEVPAPSAGVLSKQHAAEGDTVNVGDLIAEIDASAEASPESKPAASKSEPESKPAASEPESKPAASKPAPAASGGQTLMPAARAEAARTGVDTAGVQGSGRGGRVLKEDVQAAASKPAASKPAASKPAPARPAAPSEPGERERRVRMTTLRKRIAERLVQAQQTAAILTTFNEVDMSAVMKMRSSLKQDFIDAHEVKLGFMSFFVKATVSALRKFPAVNAEIDGDEIVYKNYYNVGVAVGGGKGLVVPVVRDADALSFADIEKEISRLAGLAKNNKLQLSDLTGGTFTISNGGIYGSMLSTPILNPPQTGILGLHNIVQRPMAVDGKVEIRPVMYLALSYDHRLVDGREAVQFLVHIKDAIEDPRRLLLDL
ncbi:2-oxoglutarate dehydrogenase complex dihydrolipoyllysine-residue succinyltransferase [Pseudenhygromyxa sp. WMMC2535]|uniref:2-oxoglutarate dehydrogenase complex dihydrolipoyllysine-residue succinyltransferase n=1 Tax=Pseudenhygromyxa sp. WMMC2535 TaxID=2712867 RepID=UPI001556B9AA|nr:2-oxoglutarate dehydrogenase complex dihydrolipoyllysine-residue succinyltransferase [Pseudenhygromyxa sp. WMMC2535]NVB39462.1 2-oxoglutarate dehydrogenase complex dihydrolipoyllysine-residue succinyltransferase [Pseudenhygromyxa sp. WMMC2535]